MGRYKYIIVFLIPVLLYFDICRAQVRTETAETGENFSPLLVISEDENGMKLLYRSGNSKFLPLKPEKDSYARLTLPDHTLSSEPGKPQLPVLTRLIDYDRAANAIIEISNIVTVRKYLKQEGDFDLIFPSQPGRTKKEDPQDDPVLIDRSVYDADKAYITDTVSISRIGKLRGTTIGNLEIKPAIYHPRQKYVDIILSMDISIEYTDAKPDAVSKGDESYIFDNLLGKGLINYDTEDVIPGFSLQPAGMIIVSDTSLKDFVKPLIRWKTQKGFDVSEIYIGENDIGRNFQDIKDTLNYLYNNPGNDKAAPVYLLLAGDLNYIPASEGTGYLSDMYYAEFDGEGDFIPDMFIGRLPAADTIQMKTIVNKIIQYEKFQFDDTIKHFNKAVAAAGLDGGYVKYMDGQVNYAADYFTNNPYSTDAHIFNHESNDSIRAVRYDSLKVLMKEGVGFINYTGHGTANAWLNTGISYNFPDEMTNTSRYPLIISNACLTGKYNDPDCLGSSFVRADSKGALAFIGCTNDSYWTEDFYWAVGAGTVVENPAYEETGLGFYDRLFHLNDEKPSDWYTTIGQILFAGNLAVSNSTSPRKQYYWENYTLLGDPSISPIIGTPGELSVDLPDSIPPSLKKLDITTSGFAYAGISDFDSLLDASHTTPSGSVQLDLPETAQDSILLVITRQNMEPVIRTIYFAESDTAWLSINDVNVDDATANDNGKADYSETIALQTDIQNAGNSGVDDAYIKISSSSKYIDIVNDSLFIGTFVANSELLKSGFQINIADSIPDLEIADILLKLHYNGNIIDQGMDISLHAPEPEIINCVIDDTLTGNGNGLAEAGERVKVIFRIRNNGSSTCSGVLNLSNISSYIGFDATTIVTGNIKPDSTVNIGVFANISPDTPESIELSFDTEFNSTPYIITKSLSIIAGNTTEDFELNNFTTFPWLNITDNPWVITDEYSFNNAYSAQSGSITHNQKSVLSMLLNIPEDDSIIFWYKVSSEAGYDYFNFYVDSVQIIHESGEINWTEAVINLDKGVHYLEWTYNKDGSVNGGTDHAYIDMVRFPALAFIANAIDLYSIKSPEEGKSYDEEILTVELGNLGHDTLTLISLSYSVNNDSPVNQSFPVDFKPGDTLSLSFDQTIDMTQDSTYDIKVWVSYPDNYFSTDTLKLTIVVTDIDDILIGSGGFIIAPNPVGRNIRILSNIQSENNILLLYNSSGMLIHRKEIDYISPGEEINLYPGTIPRGSYILVIQTEKEKFVYKVLKL